MVSTRRNKLRKNLGLILAFLFYMNNGFSQVEQRGVVTEISSGNKPIAGTAIVITNAPPTDSDSNGRFLLNFQRSFPGDPLLVQEIHKKGYEVVNEDEIRNWALSDKETLHIVLARDGYVDEGKRKYYRIGTTAYQRKYQEVLDKLNKERVERCISEQIYLEKVDSLNQELRNFTLKLKMYADKFARINKDQLDETEKKALSLIEEGKLEEAIQIYEDMRLLHKMEEHRETHTTAMQNLATLEQSLCQELHLLQENDPGGNQDGRVDSIFYVLTTSFPEKSSYQYAYIKRLMEKERYDEALNAYNTLLNRLSIHGTADEVRSIYAHIETLKALPALTKNPKIGILEQKIEDILRLLKYKTTN